MSFNTPFEFLIGIVDDIDVEANQAHVLDSYGRRHIVRVLPRRGGGPVPNVGESWILDRSLGELAFHSVLIPNPPAIEGDDGGNTGFRDLLSSLDAMGLIVNLVDEGEGGVIIPAGTVIPWAGTTAPTGFALCDGQAISREDFSELFDVIGTTFGSGDGSTTFNLPDLRQRFVLGKAASGTGSTLGGTGGSINHNHTVDPPNTNTSNTGAHSHNIPNTSNEVVPGGNVSGDGVANAIHIPIKKHHHTLGNTGNTGNHSHSMNIGSFSSGSSNPPFLVLNHIIATVGIVGGGVGPEGPQGDPGPQGEQGAPGADGLDGDDGTVWFSGTGAPPGGLGVLGDFYLDTDSGDVYKKTGVSSWTLIDNLTGPQGEQGIQGEIGPPGADGEDGIVQSVVAGDNITVDATDPANPVVSSTGGGSGDAGIEDILMLGGM